MATGAKKRPKSSVDLLLETIQKLLDQKEVVDKQLLKAQKKLVRRIARQTATRVRQKYVKRMNNSSTLKMALRQSMIPHQEMTMKDILAALRTTKAYRTKSKYFYTMVNNKLNRDPQIHKLKGRRGIFTFTPPKKLAHNSHKHNRSKAASAA